MQQVFVYDAAQRFNACLRVPLAELSASSPSRRALARGAPRTRHTRACTYLDLHAPRRCAGRGGRGARGRQIRRECKRRSLKHRRFSRTALCGVRRGVRPATLSRAAGRQRGRTV